MQTAELLKSFAGKKVLVIGDLMLDHYVRGRIDRISPEAPVPVLEAQEEEYRLGGAANVALNLHALGAEVFTLGIRGADFAGERLQQLMQEQGLDTSGLVLTPRRRTTLKTRMSAVNQQLLRIDYEDVSDLDEDTATLIMSRFQAVLNSCAAVIIEDYNKGLLTKELIGKIIAASRTLGIPVAVDPKHKNFFEYAGVTIFKPNFQELQKNLGTKFETEADVFRAAEELRARLNCSYLVLTRGSKGLYIFDGKAEPRHIPTFARDVYDVSGAGDTVISVLSLAFASGADIVSAATIANHAAGVVCGKLGTATASANEILASYEENNVS